MVVSSTKSYHWVRLTLVLAKFPLKEDNLHLILSKGIPGSASNFMSMAPNGVIAHFTPSL